MRTPLTYYGGKQMLARQILPFLPARRVYLEAFASNATRQSGGGDERVD